MLFGGNWPKYLEGVCTRSGMDAATSDGTDSTDPQTGPERDRVRRAGLGAICVAFWLVGATAAAPLADGHPLFGLAQASIDASPGWLATLVIETFGKLAQPLLVAGMGIGILAFGAALGAVWHRLPAAVRGRPVALGGGLLVTTAGTFVLAGVTVPAIVAGVTVLTTVPVAAFLALSLRDGTGVAGGGADASRRRPILQGLGVALVGAVGVAGATRTLVPDESGTDQPQELPAEPDASAGGSDTPAPEATDVTATAKRQEGTTRTATPTVTATPTATPEVLRRERMGQIRITEVDADGPFGFDFTGMPRTVTPAAGHYVIDKNVDDPEIDTDDWTLSVGGPAAEDAYELDFDDLTGHEESRDQVTTLLCISNEVGDGLVSTGRWRGIPLKTLVERAGPTDAAMDIVTRAADGYTEGIPWEYVREHPEVLLAYGLGGKTLPTEHGAPARLLIPGRYGMKSTKWITDIEVSDADHEGYWDQRGWSEVAVINMFSYIRAAQRRGDRVAVGGVAYAGLTGVQSVEVSLDGGETWGRADIEEPPGEYAWRRWRHDVERARGTVDVVTRMTDATGTRQTSEETAPHEGGGSTGWHQASFEV